MFPQPASRETMGRISLQNINSLPFEQFPFLCSLLTRVGQIEESIFEVSMKTDVAAFVGGGTTDIRFTTGCI